MLATTRTRLFGKGFRKAKNKQATLAQKMELAKKQQKDEQEMMDTGSDVHTSQMEKEEDANVATVTGKDDPHAEFAKLLAQSQPLQQKEGANVASKMGGDERLRSGPPRTSSIRAKKKKKTKRRRKENANQKDTHDDETDEDLPIVLQQGDKARRRDFEGLVDPHTRRPLGALRAAQLVPWVPPFLTDYLILLADPRRHSSDLRKASVFAVVSRV